MTAQLDGEILRKARDAAASEIDRATRKQERPVPVHWPSDQMVALRYALMSLARVNQGASMSTPVTILGVEFVEEIST